MRLGGPSRCASRITRFARCPNRHQLAHHRLPSSALPPTRRTWLAEFIQTRPALFPLPARARTEPSIIILLPPCAVGANRPVHRLSCTTFRDAPFHDGIGANGDYRPLPDIAARAVHRGINVSSPLHPRSPPRRLALISHCRNRNTCVAEWFPEVCWPLVMSAQLSRHCASRDFNEPRHGEPRSRGSTSHCSSVRNRVAWIPMTLRTLSPRISIGCPCRWKSAGMPIQSSVPPALRGMLPRQRPIHIGEPSSYHRRDDVL